MKEVLGIDDVDDGIVRLSALHYNTGTYLLVFDAGFVLSVCRG